MFRAVVVLGRRACLGRRPQTRPRLLRAIHDPCNFHAQAQVDNYSQALNTVIKYQRPSFHSNFLNRWVSKSPFLQSTRFVSQNSSDPVSSEEKSSTFETLEGDISNGLYSSHSSSIFDQAGDNLDSMEGFVSGNYEPVVENGDQDVDLEHYESVKVDDYSFGNDDPAVEKEPQEEVDLEKLEGVLSLLQSSTDPVEGSLQSRFESMGLALNEEFVVRVFETPLVPGENLIDFFNWVLTRPEFSVTARAVGALVQAISGELRRNNAYALWDLVKIVGERETGVITTEILNDLISLFSRLGKGKAGFEVFNKFGEFGCVPNADTYYFTIEALCRRSIFDCASSVCNVMLGGKILPHADKVGKIISYLCKGSKVKDAHSVYLLAKEMKRYPSPSSVKYLIKTLCAVDETVHLASDMLEDFSGDVRKQAIKPFSSVIWGLCRIKDIEGANKLLLEMIASGPPPGNAVFNLIITSLSKAGDMDQAVAMLKIMESRGLKPDVYTYTVVISGYAKGGEMEKACKVLDEARKKHTKLSPVTYHTLIRGYCKIEQFDEAVKLLGNMKEDGVKPNTDEYNKLIQSLCLKAIDWETAEKLLEEMKDNGLQLNGITKGLVRAVKELEEEGVGTMQ